VSVGIGDPHGDGHHGNPAGIQRGWKLMSQGSRWDGNTSRDSRGDGTKLCEIHTGIALFDWYSCSNKNLFFKLLKDVCSDHPDMDCILLL